MLLNSLLLIKLCKYMHYNPGLFDTLVVFFFFPPPKHISIIPRTPFWRILEDISQSFKAKYNKHEIGNRLDKVF